MEDKLIDILQDFQNDTNHNELNAVDDIFDLFNIVRQSKELKDFLLEIEQDKNYIHSQYFKNKAKRLRERL